MAKEQTEKALETVAKEAPASSVQSGGRVTDEEGVKAVLNPELGNTQSVAFPDGEGGADVYESGAIHTVPRELLEIKDPFGVAYLVEKKDNS